MTHPAGLLLLDKISLGKFSHNDPLLALVTVDWTNPATGFNALHTAVNSGNAETVRAVLALKPGDINSKIRIGGQTALHLAVLKNSPQIVQLLLKHGADPHLQNAAGFPPLHLAAQLRSPCAETLLSRADPLLRDASGRTAGAGPPTDWAAEVARGVALARAWKLQPTTSVSGAKKADKKKKKK